MKLSLRLDDVCPLISYTGEWRTGSKSDPDFSQYSDGGTFIVTTSNDAAATITFNGTGIAVFGAKRQNHNLYSATLDGSVTVENGHSSTETFNQQLFVSSALNNALHTLVIRDASTNTDSSQSYLDIDYIVIDTEVDDSRIQLEDTDGAFVYGPDRTSWNTAPNQLANFSSGTGHSTSTARATATLTFNGSAVDVYGMVCEQCGQYWASLDGASPVTFDSAKGWTKPQTLLYMARNLPDSVHSLTFTNLAVKSGQTLNIDYAVIYGNHPAGMAPVSTAPASTPSSSDSPTSSTKHTVSIGAVVGGVIGGVVIIAIGLGILLFIQRRRRQQERAADEAVVRPLAPSFTSAPQPSTANYFGAAESYAGSIVSAARPGIAPQGFGTESYPGSVVGSTVPAATLPTTLSAQSYGMRSANELDLMRSSNEPLPDYKTAISTDPNSTSRANESYVI